MSVLKICPSSGETHIAFPSDETASKELETIIGPLHCIGSCFFSSFLYCLSWVTHRIFPDLFDIQTNSELDVSRKSQSPESHGVSVLDISIVQILSPVDMSIETILPA